jgi:hypothetical protein
MEEKLTKMNKMEDEEGMIQEHNYVDTYHPLSWVLSAVFPCVWIGGCFPLNENVIILLLFISRKMLLCFTSVNTLDTTPNLVATAQILAEENLEKLAIESKLLNFTTLKL